LENAERMRTFVAVGVLLLTCARAHADEKDPAVAVMLSIGVPTLGVVAIGASDSGGVKLLGASALLVGPSTGRWYAGEDSTTGILVRGAGGAAAIVGVAMLVGASEADCVANDTSCSSQESAKTIGTALALGGAGVWIGSTIVDVVLAERAAVRANEHHVSIAPAVVGVHRSPGLVVAGHF
jgi:hypothetical protein